MPKKTRADYNYTTWEAQGHRYIGPNSSATLAGLDDSRQRKEYIEVVDEGFADGYYEQLQDLSVNGPYYIYPTTDNAVKIASSVPLSKEELEYIEIAPTLDPLWED